MDHFRRHVPGGTLPTFGFIIALGSFRFWQREFKAMVDASRRSEP